MMAPPAQPYQQQQPQPVNAHHHPHQAGGQPPVAQRQQGPGMAQQPVHQGSSHHGGMRRSEKRNSAGQLIIEPDDALSDKEIYPFYGPADMGKESDGGGIGVVDNYSEEEFSKYDMGSRSGAPRPAARHQVAGRYHGPRGEPPVQHSGMAYQERPRPTSPTPPSRAMRPLVEDEPPAGRGPYGRQSSGGGRGQRQPRVRWFVALFDYDPQTMSPNPDTADEELPFQEGELIKIYGGKDQDGFYKGEANGRVGYVPCNMVSEVHMDSETGEPLRARPPQHRGGGNESWGGVMRPQPKRMVALYDYDPAELSPNPDPFSELAFSTGDVIYVYGDMDEDGFYFGECRGQQGLVPSNFLTEAPADYAEAAAGQQRAGGSRHGSMQHKAAFANSASDIPAAVMSSGVSPRWGEAGPAALRRAAPSGRTRRRTRLRAAGTRRRPTSTGRSSNTSSTSSSTATSSRTSSGLPRRARPRRRRLTTTPTGRRTTSARPTRPGPSWARRSAGERLLPEDSRPARPTPPADGKPGPVTESPPLPRAKKKHRFRFLHALKKFFGIKGKRKPVQ